MAVRYRFDSCRGLFVTGTDTGVGKTLVTGAIGRHLLTTGRRRVGVFKPIATGCEIHREGLVSPDAEFLAHCSDSREPLEIINPIRYLEPVAPIVAVNRTGREIDWPKLQLSYRNIIENNDLVLVEGIGGVMVPLEEDYLVLDMMADMALPAVIVAASRLGAINHTLLSVDACRRRGIKVAAVVINLYNLDNSGLAEETNPRIIKQVGKLADIVVIPYDKTSCIETGRLGQDVLSAVGTLDWSDLIDRARG